GGARERAGFGRRILPRARDPGRDMSDDLTALTIKEASRLLRLGTISAADLVTAHVELIERVDPHVKAYLRFTPELWEKQADEAGGRSVALGTDTGGSIRQPAALCGVVGMKPTYGRVSRYGLIAFASSLDQIGPFARSVDDAAITLSLMAGFDPLDATSSDRPGLEVLNNSAGGVKGMRLGVPREYYDVKGIEPGVKAAIDAALFILRNAGAEIVDVSLPHTDYGLAAYYIIAPAECSSNLARFDGVRYGLAEVDAANITDEYLQTRRKGFGTEVRRRVMLGTYALSSGYYDAYYLKAQKVRTLIKRDFDEAFKKCDAIVSATSPTVAFPIGSKTQDPLSMYLCDVLTLGGNLAGLPGISVPCGTSDGLPVGLQVLG